MSTPEEGLLHGIQADPHDELPRLLLADWLDDIGDTQRAEFVRLQCELARGVPDLAQRDRLQQRERHLLAENGERWLGPFWRMQPAVWRFDRGVAILSMKTEELLKPQTREQAAEWFPRTWLMELNLEGDSPDRLELFDQPWLERLSALRLTGIPLGEQGTAKLVGCKRLTRLRSLALTEAQMRDRVEAISRSTKLKNLHALALSGSRAGTGGYSRWYSSPAGAKAGSELDALSIADIACLGKGPRDLRRLKLTNCELSDQHISTLVESGWPKKLTSLQLIGCRLSAEALRRLLASPCLEGLEELNLRSENIREQGGAWIASCPYLGNLRRLGLRNTGISGPGAIAITKSPHLTGLEMIDVWDSGVGRGSIERVRERFGKALWFRLEEPPCWE